MAQEHDSWLGGIGVDIGRFTDSAVETVGGAYDTAKGALFGTETAESSKATEEDAPESADEESEGSEPGLKAKIPLSKRLLPKIEGPKMHILGGRFEIQGTFDVTADGIIWLSHGEEKKVKAGSEKELAIGVVSDGFLLNFGKKWVNEKGLKIFDWNSIVTEAAMGLTATMGVEQAKLAYEVEAQTACGTVKFEAVLISYDAKKGERKVATLGLAGTTPLKLGKIKVTKGIEVDLQLSVTFGAEAEPDWAVIFQKDVLPKLEAVGIESVTVAGLFVAAVGVPVVAIKELVDIDDVNNADKKWAKLTDALVEGHRLGFTGAAAPSDAQKLESYKLAYAKFNEQVKSVMQKNAGMSEEVVRKQLSDAAAKQFEEQEGEIESAMKEKARQATWDAYGNAYRDRMYDLCNVWTKLHGGHLPRKDEVAEFMKYSKTPPMLGK